MRVLTGNAEVASTDRGLHYGDGLFETLRCQQGELPLIDAHLRRLSRGIERLAIVAVDLASIRSELSLYARHHRDADWIKLILTRGSGTRGYAPPQTTVPNLVLSHGNLPAAPERISVTISDVPLPTQPLLAGIKHLNRLPQVLARQAAADACYEAMMCDADGHIVCGIMSNVFARIDNQLVTPDTSQCGVDGVMREWVCECASVNVRTLTQDDLQRASELLLTNAVRGIVVVDDFEGRPMPAPSDATRDLITRAPVIYRSVA
ncbi:MAG: aminodeoxychorismate lyase [Pseudomonadota bacterium]